MNCFHFSTNNYLKVYKIGKRFGFHFQKIYLDFLIPWHGAVIFVEIDKKGNLKVHKDSNRENQIENFQGAN